MRESIESADSRRFPHARGDDRRACKLLYVFGRGAPALAGFHSHADPSAI